GLVQRWHGRFGLLADLLLRPASPRSPRRPTKKRRRSKPRARRAAAFVDHTVIDCRRDLVRSWSKSKVEKSKSLPKPHLSAACCPSVAKSRREARVVPGERRH